MSGMRVVAALGGNALLRRGEAPTLATQRRNLAAAAEALAGIARDHALVLTHGNGPQIGLLALQAMAAADAAGPEAPPLDVLGAESEGLIGYLIERELRPHLPGRAIATLLTQTEIDPADPAFAAPSKPIGPVLAPAVARRLAAARGWSLAPDGDGLRRVVPAPEPRRILEIDALRLLVEQGVTVVCAGGGGIPVAVGPAGEVRGVEAVIDKDLAAALLAVELEADALLLLTDVPAVLRDWGTDTAAPIARATPAALRRIAFAPGSMAPKVEAACRFVEATGAVAAIGALDAADALLRGDAGTIVAGA